MPETPVRSNRTGHLIRHVVPLVGLLVLMGVGVRKVSLRLTNDDTFFHLRFGDEFRDGWSLRNPGSVTEFGTRDWTPTQWASQLIMSFAESAGGASAVAWFAGLMLLTYVLVLYLVTRQHATPLIAAVVTSAAYIASSSGLSARPQVISYTLAVITTGAWLRTREDGRLRWWLIPMTWAWASLHGMWPVGIIVGIAAVIGIALDERSTHPLKGLLVPLGSLVACALTPLGPSLLSEVLTVGSRGEYFAEWGPTTFTEAQPIVLVCLLATVVAIWARTGGASWTHLALTLLAGGWAIYSARTVPVAAAILAPVAAATLIRLLPPSTDVFHHDRRVAWAGWGVGLVATALIVPHTLTVGPGPPQWVNERLDAMPADARVLNEWEWGGYLMWRHPDLQFVVSGYGDIYTTPELDRNVTLTTAGSGWKGQVEGLDADYALVRSGSRTRYALTESAQWTVVQDGDGVVLLAPPSEQR